ncbi:MAG: glycoside hydrolase family 3 protein, partial [Treponema sp.]|nr:glycoside hydrolase family 3 protein [Treponema sp.]
PLSAELGERENPADPLAAKDRALASRLASALDDRLLAAQAIITGIDGREALGESMAALLEAAPAGGIMLFAYNISADREAVLPFLESCSRRIAASAAGIPPLIAVDHEGGKVQRFGSPFRRLPAPGSYWETAQSRGRDYALAAIEEDARLSGLELRELGINLNFAPVAEIAAPENRAFLDDRSYGPDGAFVTAAAGAFIRGMDAAGIRCVVKHFPGNGGTDPHRETALVAADSAALDLMIAPFAALIRGGVPGGIMVSHVLVPAWDEERIASLSPLVMGDRLRRELGFTGIILGDDFSMAAVRSLGLSPGEAAVEALIAGADMVMAWPMNLRDIHGAIVSALRDGRLKRERLREGAERILYQKIRSGLIAREEE